MNSLILVRSAVEAASRNTSLIANPWLADTPVVDARRSGVRLVVPVGPSSRRRRFEQQHKLDWGLKDRATSP